MLRLKKLLCRPSLATLLEGMLRLEKQPFHEIARVPRPSLATLLEETILKSYTSNYWCNGIRVANRIEHKTIHSKLFTKQREFRVISNFIK